MTSDLSHQLKRSRISKTSEGLLNIDKPEGMTSHDVVNRVRRIAGIRRVGHAGTLDPLATGVLLVCIGRATRLIEYLVGQPKVYETTIRLGQTTDTYDADGTVVDENSYAAVTSGLVENALPLFRGRIQQRPPMYSAIKKDGQPLYKLARKGVEVERALREVTIYELELREWAPPELSLRIVCSSGTYIRSLAHDLGQTLGCGGHVRLLRRTAVGSFAVESAISLADLDQSNLVTHLQSSDTAVDHLPRLDLTDEETGPLQQGQPILRQSHHPHAALVRAYDLAGQFVGIIAGDQQQWRPRKMFHPVTNE